MSNCLDAARLQAVADGEAPDLDVRHANDCPQCRARVLTARAAASDFIRAMNAVPVPQRLNAQVREAVERSSGAGATTLRRVDRTPPAWYVAAGLVAATVAAIVFVLWPSIDAGGRLSAAAILNRSLQSLQVSGTELLKYELSLQAPSAMSSETGTFVVEQLIDHQSGRWRMVRFAVDGTPINGIAEDPATGTREAMIRHNDRTFRFQFTVTPDERLPLWQLQRRFAETIIRLVQASAAQVVSRNELPTGAQYVIDLPATEPGGNPFYDLTRAHVVVDASDYHVIELSAAGVAMGEPVAIGFRLLERSVWQTAPSTADFRLPLEGSHSIVLTGAGSKAPPQDLFAALLTELSRLNP